MEHGKKSLSNQRRYFFGRSAGKELLEIKCNSTAKDVFETMSLNDFLAKCSRIHKNVGSMAVCSTHPASFFIDIFM